MMGLYLCLALLAALSAGSDHAAHGKGEVLTVVWATTVGLALAHWFALALSSWLIHDPDLHHSTWEVLGSQTGMATVVALISTVVVVLAPMDLDRLGARVTAALFIGALVAVESRSGSASAGRSVVNGLLALTVGVGVALAKWKLSY